MSKEYKPFSDFHFAKIEFYNTCIYVLAFLTITFLTGAVRDLVFILADDKNEPIIKYCSWLYISLKSITTAAVFVLLFKMLQMLTYQIFWWQMVSPEDHRGSSSRWVRYSQEFNTSTKMFDYGIGVLYFLIGAVVIYSQVSVIFWELANIKEINRPF